MRIKKTKTFSIEPELYEKVRKEAELEDRSVSYILNSILKKRYQER